MLKRDFLTRSILFLAFLLMLGSMGCFFYIVIHIQKQATIFGYADMPIFLNAARNFLFEGVLYNPTLSDYGPAAAIYKYPPLLAALLLPIADSNRDSVLYGIWAIQVAVFFLAVLYGVYILRPPRRVALYFFTAFTISFHFTPFFETLWGLQMETLILALLIACIGFIQKKYYFPAGAMIAVASLLKIYPAFMMIFFLFRFRLSAWFGFFWTLLCIIGLMVIIFGYEENYWYVTELLPMLIDEPLLIINENANLARLLLSLDFLDNSSSSSIFSRGLCAVVISLVGGFLLCRRNLVFDKELDEIIFALLISLVLFWLANSWLNYQMLLLIPFWVLVSYAACSAYIGLWLWIAVGFVATFFTPSMSVNGFFLFPEHWHSVLSAYRALATLMVILGLLYVLGRKIKHSLSISETCNPG